MLQQLVSFEAKCSGDSKNVPQPVIEAFSSSGNWQHGVKTAYILLLGRLLMFPKDAQIVFKGGGKEVLLSQQD